MVILALSAQTQAPGALAPAPWQKFLAETQPAPFQRSATIGCSSSTADARPGYPPCSPASLSGKLPGGACRSSRRPAAKSTDETPRVREGSRGSPPAREQPPRLTDAWWAAAGAVTEVKQQRPARNQCRRRAIQSGHDRSAHSPERGAEDGRFSHATRRVRRFICSATARCPR